MSRLDVARARYGMRCECGRRKSYPAECCSECRRLDGHPLYFEFVQTLRSLGGAATIDALMLELGQSRDTVSQRGRRLARRGRVVCRIVPGYTEEAESGSRGGADATLYALVTPGAR